jgi:hypothetical protein
MTYLFRNKFIRAIIPVFAILFFLSCQKDLSNEDGLVSPGQVPDLITKVSSTVSGFVTDENDVAIMGASVSVGGISVNSDKYGFFEVKNVMVVKNAATVTVTNPGYFKGIKTFAATTGKTAFFRIKLIPKTNVGNISAAAGGNVTLTNGLVISLPANAVVNASTNAAYTGSINVAAYWINPTADDLDMIMPGDLRGIDEAGFLKGLTTYGMAAVELTSASGELLQIATGKKASLTMPLPTATLASAPSSIPLWYFDEAIGLWKQDGSAVKTGNTYVGDVSHFSYWNCDLPNAIVPLTFTVVDAMGNPVGNIHVEITPLTPSSWSHIGGYTDSTGYVSVFVTPNTTYSLTLVGTCGWGSPIYTQNFSVGTTAVDLGNIVISGSITATLTGTVTDCSNNPVTNGYIIMQNGYQSFRYALSSTGSYTFTNVICNSSTPITLIAEDATALQQSTPITQLMVPGINAIGNLQACGVSTQQFLTYTVDGGAPNTYTSPADSIFHSGFGTNSVSFIGAFPISGGSYTNFSFENIGIAPGSDQPLMNFQGSALSDSIEILTPISVHITEYGAVGQFIAGNFSGILTGQVPPNTAYNVSCSFRVRRSF